MRITFLLPRYGWTPSGGFRVVYTYANLLAERGHDVAVIHPRRLPPGGWPRPSNLGQRLHFAAGRVRDRLLRPRVRWAEPDPRVRMHYVDALTPDRIPDADAVIATWWSTAEAALALPASKGVRFHLIQGYESWNGAEERVQAVWRAPLRKIVIARWLVQRARELGVSESMMTHVPNAINQAVFRLQRPIEARPPHVAMLYSGEPYKGGDLGIEVLRRAREHVPQLTATLFGVRRGPRGLPRWIEYIHRASAQELARLFNRSAIYLCPSLTEGWHLPPAEAMACGCALVSSDIGGVRDYAIDGVTALLFPAGDSAAGTDRLVLLLRDEALRRALAVRGGALIGDFSWQRSVARLEAFLEQSRAPAAVPG